MAFPSRYSMTKSGMIMEDLHRFIFTIERMSLKFHAIDYLPEGLFQS